MDIKQGNHFEAIENNGKLELVPVAIYPDHVIKELKSQVKEIKESIKNGKQPIFDFIDSLFEELDK